MSYLSRKMSLGGGLKGWVIECPGRHLEETTLEEVLADIRSIGAKTLKDEVLDYGIFAKRTANKALDNSVLTVIYDKNGQAVGFNCMPMLEIDIHGETETVIHLGLVMVDPTTRSRGVSAMLYGFACILLLVRRQFRPIWVSSVTQVPAVVGLVSELYSKTFPTPHKQTKRSFTHLQIARRIMAHHREAFGVGPEAVFDQEKFIIQNAYTGGSDNLKKMYDDAPKHRNEIYNAMCRDELDYARGDDFLQIGVLDNAALRHYFLRKNPDSLLFGAFMAVMFFTIQSLFLPALYWFDSSKQWGELRPWKAEDTKVNA